MNDEQRQILADRLNALSHDVSDKARRVVELELQLSRARIRLDKARADLAKWQKDADW